MSIAATDCFRSSLTGMITGCNVAKFNIVCFPYIVFQDEISIFSGMLYKH